MINCFPSARLDVQVVDVGPPADWVKINVREAVRVQSDPADCLVIIGQPNQLDNRWGVIGFKKASSGKKFRSETKLVMLESRLRRLTFGSFLPAQFQTIAEDEGDESNSTSVQLEPYETGSYQVARMIQFSEEDSSSQPTLLEKPAYEGNIEVKQGLPVGYWFSDVLSKVTSAIGKPLYTDSFTATMARILYTRVLVETNV
ncbi:hypothetical protein H5410_061707 [Solanum commersonii]|uniref:Uncharacterized protein n=1 Tax=Solanum commersonii TaxID=4109 RepID=A0A9J5W8M0_SOLCO|nr:hypothetical protein H5410_061707 [Solanum commersonii]